MSYSVLVLNSDRSTGMNFIQSLDLARRSGWGQDVTVLGVASHPVRRFLTDPDRTFLTASGDEDLVGTVARVSEVTGSPVDLVYQTKSAEAMLRLSELRDRLPTFLAPHRLVAIFEDKYRTYEHVRSQGFAVPLTFLIRDRADVREAFDAIGDRVWVRDTLGQAGRGAFEAADPDAVLAEIRQRDSWGRCTISERLPTDLEHPWHERLSSRPMPGEMVTWTALYASGEMVASQVRKRLYWEHAEFARSGITGYSGAIMMVDLPDVHVLSDAIVRSFRWKPHGPLGIDYVVDSAGQLKLTEIQASRFFTSTYPMALLGLNLPQLFVDAARGIVDDVGQVNPCRDGELYVQRFGSGGRMIHRDQIQAGLARDQIRTAEPMEP